MLVHTYVLYSCIFIFSTLFVFVSGKVKSKCLRYLFLFVSFLWLFIPAAIRYKIGSDYEGYELIYSRVAEGTETRVEPLWYGLNYIFNVLLIFDFQVLVAFTSFITILFFHLSYKKKGAWLLHFGFITILYLYTYSNFRSGIVYSLIFFLLYTLTFSDLSIKKAKNRYLLISIFSFFIHYSSLFFIIIYPLLRKGILRLLNKNYIFLTYLIFLVFVFALGPIFSDLIINSTLSNKLGYSVYASSDKYFLKESASIGYVGVVKLLMLIFFIFRRKYIFDQHPKAVYLLPFIYFQLFFITIASFLQIALRLEILFSFTYIYSLYYIFYTSGSFHKVISYLFILVLIFSFYRNIYNWTYIPNEDTSINIAPYVSIFNKEDAW